MCFVFYRIGRNQQKAYEIASSLGFHVATRYKLSTGDIDGVNKDNKTAVLFLTVSADEMLRKIFINRSSKIALESILFRAAQLERKTPLFDDGLAKHWESGRAAYSNALKRVENSDK